MTLMSISRYFIFTPWHCFPIFILSSQLHLPHIVTSLLLFLLFLELHFYPPSLYSYDCNLNFYPSLSLTYIFSRHCPTFCLIALSWIYFLQTRQQGSSFLSDLKQKLFLAPSEVATAGTHYNVPLINSLVLYVGMQVIFLIPFWDLSPH